MRGRRPKPLHLRQRRNKKSGAAVLTPPGNRARVPEIPNPDGRTWHPLTAGVWARAWASPMAGQWLDADTHALGRLAVLWDEFYKHPNASTLAEIRLQEQRFGLSPIDRVRMQWVMERAGTSACSPRPTRRSTTGDPRVLLMPVTR